MGHPQHKLNGLTQRTHGMRRRAPAFLSHVSALDSKVTAVNDVI